MVIAAEEFLEFVVVASPAVGAVEGGVGELLGIGFVVGGGSGVELCGDAAFDAVHAMAMVCEFTEELELAGGHEVGGSHGGSSWGVGAMLLGSGY